MEEGRIIKQLFTQFTEIRYVAIYRQGLLQSEQRDNVTENSGTESDKYEELLVNPSLLTLARQRGNIDCGGLRYLLIAYGNFFQLVKEIKNGHISICLEKKTDATVSSESIIKFISEKYPEYL